MRIEAVTVCCGYGDFLAATLPENIALVDNIVVVTSPEDSETIAVCRKHSVRYVASNDHRRDGPFNKARLIQRGFDQIGGNDWVMHLDADIVLPRKFRSLIELAHLQEDTIYGVDRCNLQGWEKWRRLKHYAGGWDNHMHQCGHWFHPECSVSSRWVSAIHGWVPIGFMQLFHGSALTDNGYHVKTYPQHHGDAARTDVQFSLQWDRRHRHLVPEVIVLHLESEAAGLGANWKGRTTPRFGPPPSSPTPRPVS